MSKTSIVVKRIILNILFRNILTLAYENHISSQNSLGNINEQNKTGEQFETKEMKPLEVNSQNFLENKQFSLLTNKKSVIRLPTAPNLNHHIKLNENVNHSHDDEQIMISWINGTHERNMKNDLEKKYESKFLSDGNLKSLDKFLSAVLSEGELIIRDYIMLKRNLSAADGLLPSLNTNPRRPEHGDFAEEKQLLAEGRKKGNNMGGMMMMAGMLSAGTILAFSLMGISAMAGKALVTSIIALTLALLSSLKGHDKGTTYEVHTKPIYSHENSHSSELQHVHHGYK